MALNLLSLPSAVALCSHAGRQHATCLTPPSCQGMELLTSFLRKLVAERARADYDALVDSFASGMCVCVRLLRAALHGTCCGHGQHT